MAEPRQKHRLVLIVENEMMIASFLQDALESSGYGVAGPFVARADALEWLEKHTPDLAVICTMLNDGSSRDVAAELTRRGVPFIIYSGSQRDEDALREFGDGVWVEKPATNETLLDTLASLQAKPRQE
jgi:DNA-binding response OmpR family regulator